MTLGAVIGHRALLALFRGAVARSTVPASLLVAGPDGVGKRTFALALAQAVNCPERRARGGDDGCGRCAACQRIVKLQHADVRLVDRGGEATIKIQAIRERVLDVVGYRPFEGARRVFIIDGADDLTLEAQDALLKTLEEPPASAILILVTAFPDALARTVQSRCRRVRFGPLAEAEVAEVLRARGVSEADARAWASLSGGSVSRALAVGEGAYAEDRSAALALLGALGGRVTDRLAAAAALVKHGSGRRDRDALTDRLVALDSLVRDLGVVVTRSPAPLAHADLERPIRALAPAFDLDRLIGAHDLVARATADLARYASPKIVADWVAVSM
jgi:DNA polymerase-3 subunit delta'